MEGTRRPRRLDGEFSREITLEFKKVFMSRFQTKEMKMRTDKTRRMMKLKKILKKFIRETFTPSVKSFTDTGF